MHIGTKNIEMVAKGRIKMTHDARKTVDYLIKIKIKDDYDIDTVVGESLQSLLEAKMIESYEIFGKQSTKHCNILIGANEECEGLAYYDMGNMSSEEPTEFCKNCDLYEGREEWSE